jgi:hypothetical protein
MIGMQRRKIESMTANVCGVGSMDGFSTTRILILSGPLNSANGSNTARVTGLESSRAALSIARTGSHQLATMLLIGVLGCGCLTDTDIRLIVSICMRGSVHWFVDGSSRVGSAYVLTPCSARNRHPQGPPASEAAPTSDASRQHQGGAKRSQAGQMKRGKG